MSNIPDAYAEYIDRRKRGSEKPKSSTWAIIRQTLIGVTLTLGYASFAIPIVGGFIAAPLFVVAGILSWRRDNAAEIAQRNKPRRARSPDFRSEPPESLIRTFREAFSSVLPSRPDSG